MRNYKKEPNQVENLGLKNTIMEIKNSVDQQKSRLEIGEEKN